MFSDKQLAWFAFGLAAVTLGVISVSAPVYPQAFPTVRDNPTRMWPPINGQHGHLMPVPPPPDTPRQPHFILPPAEFDKPYDGDLTIKIVNTLVELEIACRVKNDKMLGCAFHNEKSCVIYLLEDSVMRQRGWNTGLLLRHEIGHCNGWPGWHPDQRAVPWPLTHWVPVHERVNR